MFDDSDHIALDNSILQAYSQFRNTQTDYLSRHFFHLWNPVGRGSTLFSPTSRGEKKTATFRLSCLRLVGSQTIKQSQNV